MAATYKDQADLTKVGLFLDRNAMAVTKYAKAILGEATSVAFHYTRASWARAAIVNPSGAVTQIINAVVQDPVFQTNSPIDQTTFTDAQVQAAVETAINTTILI